MQSWKMLDRHDSHVITNRNRELLTKMSGVLVGLGVVSHSLACQSLAS